MTAQPERRSAESALAALRDERGDREVAWKTLWSRHAFRCYRIAHRVLRSETDAWAVVNQAWLEVFEGLKPEIRDFGAWVATITRKRALDFLRQSRRRASREVELEPRHYSGLQTSSDPEANIALEEVLAAVAGCDRLTAVEARAFLLRFLGGLSYEEIARAMRQPVNSVSVYIHRARKKLRVAPDVKRLLTVLAALVVGLPGGGVL